VVSLSRKIVVQKQPSPRATMAALYPMRPAGSYTTPWDTINDRMAIAGILHQSQALSNKRLADLAAHYVASIMELENLLGRRMDEYSSIIIRFDFDTRTSAKQHLDNLAAVAKRLYAQCDALQSEIRTEMLKLGKPVSALPPAT
jgi:hypothetical protein